jgi:hypothetical protein
VGDVSIGNECFKGFSCITFEAVRSVVRMSLCFKWMCHSLMVTHYHHANWWVAASLLWRVSLRLCHMGKKSFQTVVMMAVVYRMPDLELSLICCDLKGTGLGVLTSWVAFGLGRLLPSDDGLQLDEWLIDSWIPVMGYCQKGVSWKQASRPFRRMSSRYGQVVWRSQVAWSTGHSRFSTCFKVSTSWKSLSIVRWVCNGQLDVPHASGMIMVASKDGFAVIEYAESIGLEQDVVSCIA